MAALAKALRGSPNLRSTYRSSPNGRAIYHLGIYSYSSNLFRGSETSSDGMHTVKLGEFIIKTAEFVTHVNCRHPICYYASGAGKSFLLASHGRP